MSFSIHPESESAMDTTELTRRCRYRYLAFVLLTFAFGILAQSNRSLAQDSKSFVDLSPKPIPRLAPGIVVEQHAKNGYSDLIMLVRPRLASGDIDSLPEYSKRYASLFKFVLMADVIETTRDGRPDYSLGKVGAGFAMELGGKMIVVTKDTANDHGANLGMIDRGVLGGNEDCLDDCIVVARTERMMILDAKANMLVGDRHEDRTLRHFIWASPKTGKAECMVFQLKDGANGNRQIDCDAMQWLPNSFEEDRKIHVSEGGMFSVVPTPARFALETIPTGRPVRFAPSMQSIAGRTSMTAADLQAFVNAIGESVSQSGLAKGS